MNGFYEKKREDNKRLEAHGNGNHSYPSHFHNNLEIFLVRKGDYEVIINGERHVTCGGEAFVVDSYDLHEYRQITARTDEDARVILIPYALLGRFNAQRKGLRIAVNRIEDERFCTELIGLTDKYLTPTQTESAREAAAGLILSLIFEKLQFTAEKPRGEAALVRKMLTYIQEHYLESVTRKTLSRELGYAEAHLSRVFHRFVKTGISEYINGLRLDYIARRLQEGYTGTTLELIYEAGFNSQQTYYRVRKKSKK